jgi:hypothetical protein
MRSKLVIVVARARMPVTLAAMAVIVVNIIVGSATTSCWTSATASMPRSRTCGAARRW